VLWYGFQLASALEHIHTMGVIHRDIKSENVFVMRSDVIKLGDFGLASITTPEKSKTEGSVGTPFYMAPELLQGQRYGSKVDLFAMGCVLHELAALSRAFDGENLPSIVMKIVEGTKSPIGGAFSTDLQQLVDECLESDPTKRPSALSLIEADRFANAIGGSTDQAKEVLKRCRELHGQTTTTRPTSDSSVQNIYGNLSASFNTVESNTRLCV
jgi:serine/threonine protein kinase